MFSLDHFRRNEPNSNIRFNEFYNTSTEFYNISTVSYNPYGSNINIDNIDCYNFTSSTNPTSCNDYIIQNDIINCLTFSPFRNQSNQECNDVGNNCIISSRKNSKLGLNYIIFNITSYVSPPASLVSDYFSIIFNHVYIIDSNNKTIQNNITFNIHPFNKGKFVTFEFSIKTRLTYSSIFMKGFGLSPTIQETFVDAEIKELEIADNSPYTVLLLKPKNNTIYNEEETFDYTILFIISSMGGFYGAAAGVYKLLFGSPKISPWGITQKYMCCWNLRKKYEMITAAHYVSKAGIPFADNPCQLPQGATINDRVFVLESVLRKYYLDTDYFAELNYVVKQNEKYKTRVEKLEKGV
ncbi:21042_t:CDS:2 [Cetraspora pellucida]|uniref:21042_t:CDS:1 n=1 Tax=Cetraspora pellucida TaxID=1433469 RepID=A0A9N8VJW2_9GLOM|nr:21042_t:CDS:2 [Cetraspora pellucida]